MRCRLPWHARRRAERQMLAITEWTKAAPGRPESPWPSRQVSRLADQIASVARGHMEAHDWLGVESCYRRLQAMVAEVVER